MFKYRLDMITDVFNRLVRCVFIVRVGRVLLELEHAIPAALAIRSASTHDMRKAT